MAEEPAEFGALVTSWGESGALILKDGSKVLLKSAGAVSSKSAILSLGLEEKVRDLYVANFESINEFFEACSKGIGNIQALIKSDTFKDSAKRVCQVVDTVLGTATSLLSKVVLLGRLVSFLDAIPYVGVVYEVIMVLLSLATTGTRVLQAANQLGGSNIGVLINAASAFCTVSKIALGGTQQLLKVMNMIAKTGAIDKVNHALVAKLDIVSVKSRANITADATELMSETKNFNSESFYLTCELASRGYTTAQLKSKETLEMTKVLAGNMREFSSSVSIVAGMGFDKGKEVVLKSIDELMDRTKAIKAEGLQAELGRVKEDVSKRFVDAKQHSVQDLLEYTLGSLRTAISDVMGRVMNAKVKDNEKNE